MSVSVRALNVDEARWLTAARLVAVEYAPYLAHALFATKSVAAEGLGTFAVDRGWRLYVDPATMVHWGPTLAGGVLVHEVGHLVRAHAERADTLGADLDHKLWNLCADASINDDLIAANVPLPDGVVTPAVLGLAEAVSRRSTTRRCWSEYGRTSALKAAMLVVAAPVPVMPRLPGSCRLTIPPRQLSGRPTRA